MRVATTTSQRVGSLNDNVWRGRGLNGNSETDHAGRCGVGISSELVQFRPIIPSKTAEAHQRVYYHVDLAIRTLQEQEKGNEAIREKIENDESYTPYLVRSPNDDLTYDHIIEVTEWLDAKGEEAVSSYFHSQLALHALAESFKLEFVRNWPPERKLRAWDAYERFRRDTIEHAGRTREALEERKLHRWWERPFDVIVKRKRKGS